MEKGQLTQKHAAEQLKLSERQVRRLVGKLRKQGDGAVVHGLRGRASNRRIIAETERRAVEELRRDQCRDFGPTFAAQHVSKLLDIAVDRDTVRKWMMAAGLWQSRKRGNLRVWPQEFVGIAESRRDLMRFHSESARHFMNLRASLSSLCLQLDEADTEAEFQQLLESVNGIVREQVPPYFLKACFLALVRLAALPIRDVSIDSDGGVLSISFQLSGAARAAG